MIQYAMNPDLWLGIAVGTGVASLVIGLVRCIRWLPERPGVGPSNP
jgi:hypothetical protein